MGSQFARSVCLELEVGGVYICEGFSLDDSETASAGHFRQEPD